MMTIKNLGHAHKCYVYCSFHAGNRMYERSVSWNMVIETLKKGSSGLAKYDNERKCQRFKNTRNFGRYKIEVIYAFKSNQTVIILTVIKNCRPRQQCSRRLNSMDKV